MRRSNRKHTLTTEKNEESKGESTTLISTVSGGVRFYPPSKTLWRIGGSFYDFSTFLDRHPGGSQVMLMARDRFEDATFVFEAHHHNYKKARAMIRKYKVPDAKITNRRPRRDEKGNFEDVHFDDLLDKGKTPQLIDDDSFYSVLRLRVSKYLRDVGYADGGPTIFCVFLFWFVFVSWLACMSLTYVSGSYVAAFATGIVGSWLGAFGHNWVHQAKPKRWGWALLSLDVIGFSSETWFRKHNLQHHMYTNTPWDNHYTGTDPFLVTDPTRERNWCQKYVFPYLHPIVFFVGPYVVFERNTIIHHRITKKIRIKQLMPLHSITNQTTHAIALDHRYVNYVTHCVSIFKGQENLSIGKAFLPIHMILWFHRFGFVHGFTLAFMTHGVIGLYYFTLALVNHNAEHTLDVRSRNKALDWGEAQLHVSADWAVNSSFIYSMVYLWLNFHTVHHLFPRVDFSHHPAIQQILVKTCKDFKIKYKHGSLFTLWLEMVRDVWIFLDSLQSTHLHVTRQLLLGFLVVPHFIIFISHGILNCAQTTSNTQVRNFGHPVSPLEMVYVYGGGL